MHILDNKHCKLRIIVMDTDHGSHKKIFVASLDRAVNEMDQHVSILHALQSLDCDYPKLGVNHKIKLESVCNKVFKCIESSFCV